MYQPQKPISTKDEKINAGHSHSTRSKAKRTLLCDDESCLSPAQEPPLKKQTRLGETQEDQSTKIRNIETTPNSDPIIDTNTVEESTPAEIALQNNLVFETLFGYVNRSDLLSCRIVNKQWQYEATNELQRRKLVIRFAFQRCGYQTGRNILFHDICRRLSECTTPSLLSSFQVKTVTSNDLGSVGVRNIFTTIGNQLKHLKLHLNYLGKHFGSSFVRSSVMKDLQNLLCRQAPNLEYLDIEFDFPFHWHCEVEALNSSDQPHYDKTEFLMILPNLKTFIVSGSPPAKFFVDVVNAAVNLRSFGGPWSVCIKYLMGAEGITKIHKLKCLQLADHDEVRWHSLNLEPMETFLTKHKQNLKLESLESASDFIRGHTPFALRFVGAINQILECSSESLLKLRIEPANWFDDLLIIPRLPKLQEISFHRDLIRRTPGGCGFFPRGFNINNSLPKVSSIILLSCTQELFLQFCDRMRIEIAEPVPSIRNIILKNEKKEGLYQPPLAALTELRHFFPNLVSVSYVDSDNYYEI